MTNDRPTGPGNTPEDTPGLDSGNSPQPGDTPPDAGTSDTTSHGAPPAKSPSSAKPLIIAGILLVVLIALFFIGYIAGLIG